MVRLEAKGAGRNEKSGHGQRRLAGSTSSAGPAVGKSQRHDRTPCSPKVQQRCSCVGLLSGSEMPVAVVEHDEGCRPRGGKRHAALSCVHRMTICAVEEFARTFDFHRDVVMAWVSGPGSGLGSAEPRARRNDESCLRSRAITAAQELAPRRHNSKREAFASAAGGGIEA